MPKPGKPIPDGYHTLTPYVIVDGAAKALEFYKEALGAQEMFRMPGPNGKIMHSEMKIGNSMMMLADAMPEMGFPAPTPGQAVPVGFCLYVEDCDKAIEKAVAAGAKVVRPTTDQFYGDRSGTVLDPFGHTWTIATHKIDMTPEELQEAQKQAFSSGAKS